MALIPTLNAFSHRCSRLKGRYTMVRYSTVITSYSIHYTKLYEAVKAQISPMLLGLLALATGDVAGDRLLKKLLPRVDGAAKDLMLMTVCRLCG